MAVVEDLSEAERYLLAILQDQSGIDIAEFLWMDPTSKDLVYRCWDFQYAWYRTKEKFQIDQCARAIGKSEGMQMRGFAFAFTNPGEEMLVTAPEMIHLEPVTKKIESRLMDSRITREMLKASGTSNGITHKPFEATFRNGARIVGRIPQKDGKGVKGMHPKKLEMDEAQDYPEPGWVELGETLKYGEEDATWRAHGVSRGVRDRYYKQTQKGSGWFVHRYTAMHRPDWTEQEREAKAELYGSRNHPDYRRNILGLHGDASSALFVLARLMACVDTQQASHYNREEYVQIRLNDERVRESGLDIEELLDFPLIHQAYGRTWAGMDVGMTNHPSEILIFGEMYREGGGTARRGLKVEGNNVTPAMRLKLLCRVHLERISAPDQRRVMAKIQDFYHPVRFSMDRTGLGLPIFQDIVEGDHYELSRAIRGYNFSEKVAVGFDNRDEHMFDPDDPMANAIEANVLEYSSDQLRMIVDRGEMLLPWDQELLREFQGQTYVTKSSTNAYGRKQFNAGKFHALDAARMAILGFVLHPIDERLAVPDYGEPVLDGFVML